MKLSALTTIAGLAVASMAQAQEESPYSFFVGGSLGYVIGDYELGAAGKAIGLGDWDEPIHALQLGVENRGPHGSHGSAFFLEVGLTENDARSRGGAKGSEVETELDSLFGTGAGSTLLQGVFPNYADTDIITATLNVDVEIIPITLNYRNEYDLAGELNYYFGLGAGIALVDIKTRFGLSNNNGDPAVADSVSFDDSTYYVHIFAGLSYDLSESFAVFGGARYIFMGNIDLGNTNLGAAGADFTSTDSPIDHAVQFELGARFSF